MRLMMTMVVMRSMMTGMLMKIMIIALMPASFIPKYVMPTYMWWGFHPSGNIKPNVFVLLYGTRGTCVVSWFVVMYNKLIPWPTVAIMPKHTPGSSCANKAIINGSCGVFLLTYLQNLWEIFLLDIFLLKSWESLHYWLDYRMNIWGWRNKVVNYIWK